MTKISDLPESEESEIIWLKMPELYNFKPQPDMTFEELREIIMKLFHWRVDERTLEPLSISTRRHFAKVK